MLEFDEKAHVYRLDGKKIPSVTQVMQGSGLSVNYEYCTEQVRQFGVLGHATIKLLLEGELAGYDTAFEPWMVGIKKFIAEHTPEPIKARSCDAEYADPEVDDVDPDVSLALEYRAYSKRLKYAGTCDFIGYLDGEDKVIPGSLLVTDNRPVVLDWKFWGAASKDALAAADIQTAAYGSMIAECWGVPRMRRGVVHFFEAGYRLYELTDPAAHAAFLSGLNIYQWRKNHGYRDNAGSGDSE